MESLDVRLLAGDINVQVGLLDRPVQGRFSLHPALLLSVLPSFLPSSFQSKGVVATTAATSHCDGDPLHG